MVCSICVRAIYEFARTPPLGHYTTLLYSSTPPLGHYTTSVYADMPPLGLYTTLLYSSTIHPSCVSHVRVLAA